SLPSPHPSPTHIPTLSLHDALPISLSPGSGTADWQFLSCRNDDCRGYRFDRRVWSENLDAVDHDTYRKNGESRQNRKVSVIHHRSEEHTSELQSRGHLVCRLLLEKK